jgi:hypothetical protein
MLAIPNRGPGVLEGNTGTTNADPGVTVTADATIHTKGAWAQIIASTARDAYGITVFIAATAGAASSNQRYLVDIGIGAASSEVVLIPDLMCGNASAFNAASNTGPAMFHFPIYIPAGSRISARGQALVTVKTCRVHAWLHEAPTGPGGWVGSRVTAYGINNATSSGVAHTCGNNSYASPTEIVASSSAPIKYLQVARDLGTATNGNSVRGLLRIGVGSTPDYIASDLPYAESTTLETVTFAPANFLLSHMRFDLPAATRLTISAMWNATGAARNFALYGVD